MQVEQEPEKQPQGATRDFGPETPDFDPYADATTMEKLLPSTMANKGNFSTAIGRDGRPIQTNVNPLQLAGDVMGIPTRALGSATGQGSMADPESGIMRPVRERMTETMKDPEAGYFKKGLAGMGYLGASVLEDPTTFTGIGWAKAPQKAKDIIKTGLQGAKQATKTAIKAPNKIIGRASEELSGVSEEALRKAKGFPIFQRGGRKELEQFADKQDEIGQRLIDKIQELSKGMPEQEAVQKSLEGMGDMSLESAIEALESAKSKIGGEGIKFRNERSASSLIDDYINQLKSVKETDPTYFRNTGKTKEVPATSYKKIRERLDQNINYDIEGANLVNDALKTGRTTMKDELIKKAELSGDFEYAKNMKSWGDKIDKIERYAKMLGGDPETQSARIEKFIGTLFGKNTKNKRKFMADFEELYGGETLREAKLASLAGEFGKEGKAGIFPRQFTGKAILGHVVAPGLNIPFTSPYIVTRITLPVAEVLEKIALKTGGVFSKTAEKAFKTMLGTTDRALQTRLLAVITKEAGKLGNKEEK